MSGENGHGLLLGLPYYSNPEVDRKAGNLEICVKYHLYITFWKHFCIVLGMTIKGNQLQQHSLVTTTNQHQFSPTPPPKECPSDPLQASARIAVVDV
jgi:hypothetical protein